MPTKSQKIQHLYNRAAFGLSFQQFEQKRKGKLKLRQELKELLEEGIDEIPLEVIADNPFVEFKEDWENRKGSRSEVQKLFREKVRETRRQVRGMSLRWMALLTDQNTAVREKLTLFWHDHFAVRTDNGYHAQLHNNVLRKYALGKYRDMLLAVSKDAAMLGFLNNQQNNKRKPNENFARELLELYTLGRGYYTENDIKNAAKAFTGWKYDRFTCQFRFVDRQHDKSEKEFMGHSGDLNGEDIIDVVLANRQTALFLSAKLFQYYVSDQADEVIIGKMADRLFKNDYHIGDLLHYIFSSDWFYEKRFVNNKIKSPQELIHGVRQHFGLEYGSPEALLYLQNSLGQRLFFPPNVNGWSVGREWINSSSLVNRMRLVSQLTKNEELGIRIKDDLDGQTRGIRGSRKFLSTGRMDWPEFEKQLKDLPKEEMADRLADFLINQPLKSETKETILRGVRDQKAEKRIKWLAVTIASLPEYQLT
ncbi:MAG: DUF1800 domain-containing protein [Roseivirga sp.]|nr:DUF1800 domain-containing protein [Roseivirga sp.]